MEALGQRGTIAVAATLNFVVGGGAIILGYMLRSGKDADKQENGRGDSFNSGQGPETTDDDSQSNSDDCKTDQYPAKDRNSTRPFLLGGRFRIFVTKIMTTFEAINGRTGILFCTSFTNSHCKPF